MSNTNSFLGTESNLAMNVTSAKLINARVNRLNNVAFDGRFSDMPQHEDFAVSPYSLVASRVVIKSDFRIGWIHRDGSVYLSPEIDGGANSTHLSMAVLVDKINPEELFSIQTCVFGSAHAKAIAKAKGKTPSRVSAHA